MCTDCHQTAKEVLLQGWYLVQLIICVLFYLVSALALEHYGSLYLVFWNLVIEHFVEFIEDAFGLNKLEMDLRFTDTNPFVVVWMGSFSSGMDRPFILVNFEIHFYIESFEILLSKLILQSKCNLIFFLFIFILHITILFLFFKELHEHQKEAGKKAWRDLIF